MQNQKFNHFQIYDGMIHWSCLLVFCLLSQNVFSQSTTDIASFQNKFYDVLYLAPGISYYEDVDDISNPEEVQELDFTTYDKSFFYIDLASKSAWFRFDLYNSLSVTETIAFRFPRADTYRIYHLNEGRTKLLKESDGDSNFLYEMESEETLALLVHLENASESLGKQGISIYTKDSWDRLTYRRSQKIFNVVIVNSFFIGAILILLLYHFVLYIQSRLALYKYYCFYVLSLAIYFFAKHPLFLNFYSSDEVTASRFFIFNFLIQFVVFITYVLFTRMIWETKEKFPTFDKLIRWAIGGTIGFSILFLANILLTGSQLVPMFDVYRISISLFIFGTLIYLSRYYAPGTKYYIFGLSFYLLFGILALLDAKFDFTDYRNLYMHIGATIEILFFAFGLGYRIKESEQEKIEIQSNLIGEYKKNEKLQKRLQDEIAKELSIAKKEKEIALLESHLLRSRMNPHFIFNSMNALKRFVLENKQDEAVDYLDQFATLLRQVLSNTGEKTIPLDKELDSIENYLSLERSRLGDTFEYRIDMDPNIEAKQIMIPPMLLQPFIENSIWHGLRYLKNKEGVIELQVNKEKGGIMISIIDNGIGRKASGIINKGQRKDHTSLATTLIEQRLDLLKSYDGILVDINIKDGEPEGTIVEIKLPMAELNQQSMAQIHGNGKEG